MASHSKISTCPPFYSLYILETQAYFILNTPSLVFLTESGLLNGPRLISWSPLLCLGVLSNILALLTLCRTVLGFYYLLRCLCCILLLMFNCLSDDLLIHVVGDWSFFVILLKFTRSMLIHKMEKSS